jgi:hypothetical protein
MKYKHSKEKQKEVLKKYAGGGEIEFEKANLYLVGRGRDVNGNKVVKISFPNQRPFSIQTLGNLPKTHRIFREYDKNEDITPADVKTIENEIVAYIEEFGSKKQKQSLKKYAEKGVYVETLDEEIDLSEDGRVKAIKTQQGGNKSFGERREMHGASPEALAFAEGGSLGNHGLKQGDQIIKTMSGGVQKVKTKSGDIVYVNLANGYRGDVPPLPFDGGGRLKSALMRDRKNVNYSQDYEVRYSKDKSHRSGYTKPKMSRTQFEEESFEFFDGGGKLKKGRYSILGEVDGEQPFLYATTDDRSKIKGLVNMAEIDFYELTGKKHNIFVTDEVTDDEVYNYGNGGRTRERKYVNHSQDYEVRYSKDKPHRRGYGYAEGGFIDGFNPKSFSLAEIDEKLRDNDIYIQWLQMGDISTSADKRDFLWTNTSSSTKWNKVKDLRLTISDYGLLELSKGSENLYLNFVVYKKNGYDPMNIQIYTKDNHAGLKQFARQIVDKFEEGGQLEMEYAGGGKIETKIQKKVDEINDLIKKAIDSDGDPLMVVDTTGTWEEPMQYKPIIYKNGRLYIEYFEPYSGKTEKEVVNKSNIDLDGYPTLLNIAKMYRKALKEKGISYAGGGSTEVGYFKNEIDNDYISEINKYFNKWNNIKTEKDSENFKKIKPPMFGTYKNVTILEQISKFENQDVPFGANQVLRNDFKKEVSKIIDKLSNSKSYSGGGEIKIGDKIKVKASGIGEGYVIVEGIDTEKGILTKKDNPNTYLSVRDDEGYLWEIYFQEVVEFPSKTKYDSKMSGGGISNKLTLYKSNYLSTANKQVLTSKDGKDIYIYENEILYDSPDGKTKGASHRMSKLELNILPFTKLSNQKIATGGKTNRGGAMVLAKEIRKDGESWQSALKRANEQLKK